MNTKMFKKVWRILYIYVAKNITELNSVCQIEL